MYVREFRRYYYFYFQPTMHVKGAGNSLSPSARAGEGFWHRAIYQRVVRLTGGESSSARTRGQRVGG